MTHDPPSDRTDQTLQRIAASLGCSVEDLVTGQRLSADLADTQELLALWNRIATDAARESLLEAARAIVRGQRPS